jgi:hypothetical protein
VFVDVIEHQQHFVDFDLDVHFDFNDGGPVARADDGTADHDDVAHSSRSGNCGESATENSRLARQEPKEPQEAAGKPAASSRISR